MTTLVSLDSASYEIGSNIIISDCTFAVTPDARIGVVGPNGSGKSTILRMLAGFIEPDQGRVVTYGNTSIGYVPQSENFENNQSVLELAIQRLRTHQVGDPRVAAEIALSKAGFNDMEQSVETLSGGWKKRLALCIEFSKDTDVLLLDEPTNHLDLAGLHWLENYLQETNQAWVIVSHDRTFLNRTTTSIVEVAPYYESNLFFAEGNYDAFIDKRTQHFEKQASVLAKLKNKHRTESDWVSRGPKARGTKANYRLKSFERLESELARIQSLSPASAVATHFESNERKSKELLELESVSFSYGDTRILKDQSLLLKNNSCLGILGTNGQGKSTILKIIMGEIAPDSGKLKRADSVSIAYFDQERGKLELDETVKAALGDGSDQVVYQGSSHHVVSWGKRFGFQPEDFDKQVSNLSGGEKARILLSKLVRISADVLVLDEPTNDLDIPMLECLESMIASFPGAVVLVSHDRYLLEKVCRSFLGFTESGELESFASYEQWESQRLDTQPEQVTVKPKTEKKLSESERKEYQKMERRIEKAEQQLAEIEALAATEAVFSDPEKALKIAEEMKSLQEEIEGMYARWDELERRR